MARFFLINAVFITLMIAMMLAGVSSFAVWGVFVAIWCLVDYFYAW